MRKAGVGKTSKALEKDNGERLLSSGKTFVIKHIIHPSPSGFLSHYPTNPLEGHHFH